MGEPGLHLSGVEWQRWANQLLISHYGPTNYVKIPDSEGDGGIEGFTRTEGHAYQAYGALPGKTAKQLYESQRDKMTTDIGKFIDNRKFFVRLFGNTKISKWVLFVPTVGLKDIHFHANSKTDEVAQAGLPYVATDFAVTVCDEESFAAERDRLLSFQTDSIFIDSDTPDESTIDAWAATNASLVQTLNGKLSKVDTLPSAVERQAFGRKVLTWHLEGQNLLAQLQGLSPIIHERVWKAKNQYEKTLYSLQLSSRASGEVFLRTLTEFQNTLKEIAKSLSTLNSQALAHEAVADWLLRCPLDFPEHASNV